MKPSSSDCQKCLAEFAAAAANKVHSFFAAAPPKGTSVGRVRREKYFARRECVFAHFMRENARVGAKTLLSKKGAALF